MRQERLPCSSPTCSESAYRGRPGCFLGIAVFTYGEYASAGTEPKILSAPPGRDCWLQSSLELVCTFREETEPFAPGDSAKYIVGFERRSGGFLRVSATVTFACNHTCLPAPDGIPIEAATVEYEHEAEDVSGSPPKLCRAYSVPRGSILSVPPPQGLLAGTDSVRPAPTSVRLRRISFGHAKLHLSSASGDFTFLASAKRSSLATMEYDLLGPTGEVVAQGTAYLSIGKGKTAPARCQTSEASSQSLAGAKKKATKAQPEQHGLAKSGRKGHFEPRNVGKNHANVNTKLPIGRKDFLVESHATMGDCWTPQAQWKVRLLSGWEDVTPHAATLRYLWWRYFTKGPVSALAAETYIETNAPHGSGSLGRGDYGKAYFEGTSDKWKAVGTFKQSYDETFATEHRDEQLSLLLTKEIGPEGPGWERESPLGGFFPCAGGSMTVAFIIGPPYPRVTFGQQRP
ncbi:MAG TPA: hypothetical protein VGC63_02100 [Solirubrobacterales bacterium]|jgi:hypothetical protein